MQSTIEAERQRQYYDCIANAILLEPGNLVLAKGQCLQRVEGGEGLVGEGTMQNGTQNCRRHPFLPHDKQVDWTLVSPPLGLAFSHYPHSGGPVVFRCAS